MGRGFSTRAPHYNFEKNAQPVRLVATVASGVIGDGPRRILRAGHNLIKEAAVLIFGDDLDAGAATVHVADRK